MGFHYILNPPRIQDAGILLTSSSKLITIKPIMSLLSGGAFCSFVLNPVAVGMTISFVQDIA